MNKPLDRKDLKIVGVQRSWATLTIKAVDDDKREISGVASTPETDRMGDIVEPLGAKFKNPVPLLWQHRASEPVGNARLEKPTEDGINFTAKIAKPTEPGRLKDRIDEVWQSLKLGLIRGVSIGFRAIEYAFMDTGIRFTEVEIVELSLVTIPANTDATITEIRSLDKNILAASGNEDVRPSPKPGVTGSTQQGTNTMKTIADQIAAYQARRKTASDRMTELMTKSSEAGTTLDEAESQEYDTLESEVEQIDKHIARLAKLEKQNTAAAIVVRGNDVRAGSESREVSTGRGVVSIKSNVPAGIAFTRYCMATAAAKGNRLEALHIFRSNKQWMSETPEVEQVLEADINMMFQRAAVAPGTTGIGDGTWAGPMVVAQNMASEFAEFLRPLTIIGRIPNLRRVPFNISLPRATSGTSVGWVGENAPKPVSSMAFDTVTLRWAKAAAIVVLTQELVRFSNPAAEQVVRADLAAAMTYFLDRQFVDPSVAAVTNVSPASITNGVTPITASGTTAAAFRADIRLLFQQIFNANLQAGGGVWIMTQLQALSLSLMINSLGQQLYPTVNPQTGGTLLGYPIIISENLPATGGSPADGWPIIFAIAPEIMLADDGQILIDASAEASVQMDTAPDSPPSASTNMISLWQMNMLGLRAERWINWQKRRSTAVQFIQNAKYTE